MTTTNPPADDAVAAAAELVGAIRAHPGRPHVVLKYAQTLDGRIAATGGDAKWISCERERVISHAVRARCDAVLVGSGTVASDDPKLNVRLVEGRSPLRVVLDSALRTSCDAQVLGGGPPTVLVTTARAATRDRQRVRRAGAEVWEVPAGPDGVDLPAALAALRDAGVGALMVEGGARVLTSMLRAGLVDRVVTGIAPRILGAGVEAIGDLHNRRVADGIPLRRACVQVVEDDVLVAYDVGAGGPA
ncbi:RibD family protein [Saccharopolyspora griseoalba]|uniref:RibD family protein n=1 Tax=Saccharopolyspora griseoalba TaxID=1431848 RepID=A0ABW2LMR6_9PSEU